MVDTAQTIETFLRAVLGDHVGIAMILTVKRSTVDNKGSTRPFQYPAELPRMVNTIMELDEAGVDVYFNVGLFQRKEVESRWEVRAHKDFILSNPCIWIDADQCHPEYLSVKPSISLETSPGSYQAFWPLTHTISADQAEDIAKRLAYAHITKGADSGGWQCNKYMRIPGTHNHKLERVLADGTRPLIKILRFSSDPVDPSVFDALPTVEETRAIQPTRVYEGSSAADYVGTGKKYIYPESYPDMPTLPNGATYPQDIENIWNLHELDDRSGWANAIVKGLYQCGIPDEEIIAAMVGHPIYVDKAHEKWDGQPSAIREDVERILIRLRENGVMPRLVLGKKANAEQQKPAPLVEEIIGWQQGRVNVRGAQKKLMTPREVVDMPKLPWLIDGYIPQKAHINLFGPSGIGKSFQVLDWAMRISKGDTWNQARTQQGPVVYIIAEGLEMMGERIEAWCATKGCEIPDRENLFFYGEPFQIKDAMSVYDFVVDITNALRGIPPVLVIFDTLSQCLVGANENAAEDMSAVNGVMAGIRERFECATLVVHHTGYDGDHERGHSSFPASAATRIRIDERMGQLVLECEKQRGGKEFSEVYVNRKKALNSLVLVPAVDAAEFLTVDTVGPRHMRILTPLRDGAVLGVVELQTQTGLHERTFIRYKSELERSKYIETYDRKVHILPAGLTVFNEVKRRDAEEKAARSKLVSPTLALPTKVGIEAM